MKRGSRRRVHHEETGDGTGKTQGPTEDEHGNRLHSAAGQAVNETFGGLALGFSGGPDPDAPPVDVTYRSLMFKPGTNLGPQYPNDIRMTTTCLPTLVRKGDPRLKLMSEGKTLPQMAATFSPPPSLPQGQGATKGSFSHPPGPPPTTPKAWDPCGDWLPECVGEDPINHAFDYPNNMFLFFGPPSEQPRPPFCPPNVETTEEAVYDYFDSHNIEAMMEYFLTLLCINLPDDPFEYIQDLCDQMIRCRTDKSELERLDSVFEPSHLLAMFSLFDKQERKYISMEQYKNAMEMLGITRYNPQPIGYKEDIITEDVFFEETSKALALLINTFTG